VDVSEIQRLLPPGTGTLHARQLCGYSVLALTFYLDDDPAWIMVVPDSQDTAGMVANRAVNCRRVFERMHGVRTT
jgi:hypothetical protein